MNWIRCSAAKAQPAQSFLTQRQTDTQCAKQERRGEQAFHSRTHSYSVKDLIGPNFEVFQFGGPKCIADCDVRGIPTARDDEPADAPRIIARIEDMPLAVQEYFHARREVHGCICRWHADVAEISRGV